MKDSRETTTTKTTIETKAPGVIRRLLIKTGLLSDHTTDHARKLVAWSPSGGDNFWPNELRNQITYKGCNTIKRI